MSWVSLGGVPLDSHENMSLMVWVGAALPIIIYVYLRNREWILGKIVDVDVLKQWRQWKNYEKLDGNILGDFVSYMANDRKEAKMDAFQIPKS